LLAPEAISLNTAAGGLTNAHGFPFLALARLVVGRGAAIGGHLSQLNPSTFKSENTIIYGANRSSASVSKAR
jgi:hypothetical protein